MSPSTISRRHQLIEEDDIAAVEAVLRGDSLTQGPTVALFELAVARYCGARHACAVSNATAGLHLACLALGLERGGRVWTSPIAFIDSANCARYCGASVDFVDIDPRSYCISVDALEQKLEQAELQGRLPDILIGVDFAGQPCEWDRIVQLKRRFGFRVIENASHSFGAELHARRTGSFVGVDCAVFSFHPSKILTTGEGGVVVTEDAALDLALRQMRSHGLTQETEQLCRPDEGGWYYEQQILGFNFRMSDIAAALGHSQLAKADRFLARRREIAARYDRALENVEVLRPWQSPEAHSSFHIYPVLLATPEIRHQVFDDLCERGVEVQVHYIPIHLQPDFMRRGFSRGDFPIAEAYYERTLSLPVHAALSDGEQDLVIHELRQAIERAS